MQKCKQCGISVRGDKICCPLCGGPVTGDPSERVYPTQPKMGHGGLLEFKILSLIYVFLLLAFLIVHVATGFQLLWVTIVMISITLLYVDLLWTFYEHGSFLRNLNWQSWIGIGVCIVLNFYFSGPMWSLYWVYPFGLLAQSAVTMIIGFCQGRSVEEFVLFILVSTGLSFGQLYFILNGYNRILLPAVCSMAVLLVLSMVLVIFWHREVKRASEKMFHM